MNTKNTSKISGFYKLSIEERLEHIQEWVSEDNLPLLKETYSGGLRLDQANHMIENVIGLYNLPFAVATNFFVNKKDYLMPMVIEEPSVVAAVSFAAKLFRDGGGFKTSSDDPVMIGQMQVLDIPDIDAATRKIIENKPSLLKKADEKGGSIIRRGGGARDIEVRSIENTAIGNMLVVHLLFDCRDAMGANAINTAVEYLAPEIENLTGGRVNLKILSNLTDKRKARAEGVIPAEKLARNGLSGDEVIQSILEAAVFAEVDPYRATTHNKGIMNGIDAVLLATGNDWRAVEAGAHAYAARGHSYTSLTKWRKDENGNLHGAIELPLAVGIVGGATRVHPMAQLAMEILNVDSAQQLSEVIAAVGLAQNFAAIRALATEGIQQGHMRMHARQLAIAAGASDEQVMDVVHQMIAEKTIRLEHAKQIVDTLNKGKNNAG